MRSSSRISSSGLGYGFLLSLLAVWISNVQGSITMVDTEASYQSKPDHKIGTSLWEGYAYRAHLQYIHSSLSLCGDSTWKITNVPPDGIPVALFVKKGGGCSIEDKARAASTQIHPKGVVRYIIVDGESSIKESDSDVWAINAPLKGFQELEMQEFEYDDTDDAGEEWVGDIQDSNDDEAAPKSLKRVLRKRHKKHDSTNDDIDVSVLHVSYTTGYLLLDAVIRQDAPTEQNGGPQLLLDGRAPATSGRTVFLWVLLSASLSGTACCCLMLFVRSGFLHEPPAPPTRPRPRRLTNLQVRANFPHFQYCEGDCPDEGGHHECSICLDEFEIGARMRRLPCKHVFHANCVAKWLIERSATCPLCKMDLYEEDEESSDDQSETAPEVTNQTVPDWFGDRIASIEREFQRRREQRSAWWQRQNSSGAREGTSTRSSWFSGGTSWFGSRFHNRVAPQSTSPGLTELTEPLLQGDEGQEQEMLDTSPREGIEADPSQSPVAQTEADTAASSAAPPSSAEV